MEGTEQLPNHAKATSLQCVTVGRECFVIGAPSTSLPSFCHFSALILLLCTYVLLFSWLAQHLAGDDALKRIPFRLV
jgi:hypothetical protein